MDEKIGFLISFQSSLQFVNLYKTCSPKKVKIYEHQLKNIIMEFLKKIGKVIME